MKLVVKYFSGQQFDSFYEYTYLVEDKNETPIYKISVFVNDDESHESYIVNEQTGYVSHHKGFGLADSVATILSEVAKGNPDAKLLMVGELED